MKVKLQSQYHPIALIITKYSHQTELIDWQMYLGTVVSRNSMSYPVSSQIIKVKVDSPNTRYPWCQIRCSCNIQWHLISRYALQYSFINTHKKEYEVNGNQIKHNINPPFVCWELKSNQKKEKKKKRSLFRIKFQLQSSKISHSLTQ